MRMVTEYLIVGLLVGLCLLYAVWRIRQAILLRNDPCAGCTGCQLKDAACHQRRK